MKGDDGYALSVVDAIKLFLKKIYIYRKLRNIKRAVVVVKRSACMPSTPTIQIQILRRLQFFCKKSYLKRVKINKKEAGVGPYKKVCYDV